MSGFQLAAMIGSSLIQAQAQHSQGQAASRMATIQANQLQENASLADAAANDQAAVGQRAASEALRQNKMLQSRQIALAAAGGGSTSEKNIADLISNTAGEGEYAALTALYEGNSRADSLRNEAIGLRRKAMVTRFEGKQARQAGNINAVSSLLSSGSKSATFYNKYNTAPNNIALTQTTNSGIYSETDF